MAIDHIFNVPILHPALPLLHSKLTRKPYGDFCQPCRINPLYRLPPSTRPILLNVRRIKPTVIKPTSSIPVEVSSPDDTSQMKQKLMPQASYSQGNQNGLNNMQTLKSSLPSQGSLDSGNDNRQTYNNPGLVVYTPAMSTYYNQQNAEQMPYLAANMMPTYYGNNGMGSSYAWPYISPAVTMDGPRRPSWSSNENITLAQNGVQDYYPPMSYMPLTTGQSQHYIAGPIQPMKCADNKSYEMVNLDELVSRDPPIPRAVPALWTNQEELSLAKCLQNPEGITNVYIRGFMPDTTDTDLDQWASRFGEIESCKAIIEQDTGKCKGFGFVMYYSPAAAENCIRGFFHLGFQASYAQKSRNSRLKDLEDKASTNIYCTGVPIEWNESVSQASSPSVTVLTLHQDLANHFRPFDAISTKICRDVPSGVSKEVGFARYVPFRHHRHCLTLSDSSLVRLLSVSFESSTAISSSTMASSSAFASPTPKLRSSLSNRVKNVATGAAASTAIRSSTLHRLP